MCSSLSDMVRPAHVTDTLAAFPTAPDELARRLFKRWRSAYGAVCRVPAESGAVRHWVISEPALVQQISARHSANHANGMSLARVHLRFGNGIMVSDCDLWARQRRLIQPASGHAGWLISVP